MGAVKGLIGWLIVGMALGSFGCQPTAQVTHGQGPSVAEALMERYDGPRARIAVGDFQVKASGASNEIGDGLREMLVTALFNTNRFIVLERQAIQDILLEQDLGATGRVKRGTGASIGQLEGAEILVYGVVSEFETDSKGSGISLGVPSVPLRIGGGVSNAHMAVDLRAVETATGRIICATRVKGNASDYSVKIRTRIGGGSGLMPVSLGSYQNTPMEEAIRVTIDTAVSYLASQTPPQYFRF